MKNGYCCVPRPMACRGRRLGAGYHVFGIGLLALCGGFSGDLKAAEAPVALLPGVEDYSLSESRDTASPLPLSVLREDHGGEPEEPAPALPSGQACALTSSCFSPLSFAQGTGHPALPPGHSGPPDAAPSPAPVESRYRSFGGQAGAVKWEMAAILAYYTAINGSKLFKDPEWPHFHSEGWFGKSTANMGVDKLAHSYSTYVVSEILYARLKRKTNNAPGIQFTAAALASATMLYTEIWDSIEPTAGWSWEDVAFNSMGAGFSILRNSVPKLDEKLDFRLMIMPHSGIISAEGKRHFEQQRYYFALKFSGFEGLNKGPLRFLELHAGYYAKDFTNRDRELGIAPKRRIFVGVGINLRELFFRDSRSRVGRAIGEGLDYLQPPYTAIRRHITN